MEEFKSNSLKRLDPFIDSQGLLRVGGRVHMADFPDQKKHPLVIPTKHHIAELIIEHYHSQVAHQGCHLSAGAMHMTGLLEAKSSSVESSINASCVENSEESW